MDYKKVTQCRICGSEKLKKYLDLGNQPLANSLLVSKYALSKEYPLEVLFCEECSLSQLSVVVDPKVMYTDYPYHSSVSKTFQDHCYELAKKVHETNKDSGEDHLTLMDIASNDGCLLEQFSKFYDYDRMRFWPIGVEPSKNLADESERRGKEIGIGFQIHNDFFHKDAVLPRVDVVTALNVLAHVDEVNGFVYAISKRLKWCVKSFCVIEVPYFVDLIEKVAFDTIYHEHLSYFLVKPLMKLFDQNNMRIFKIERVAIHGGSIRIFACLKEYKFRRYEDGYIPTGRKSDAEHSIEYKVLSEDVYPTESSVMDLETLEESLGLHRFDSYEAFSDKVEKLKDDFIDLLDDLREKGMTVSGYGASAKGISLINYCGVTNEDISYIADDTPDKQGKFTPGSGIPIVSSVHFNTNHPDYIAIMAWNFSAELKEKSKHVGAKYIVPIPQVRIE